MSSSADNISRSTVNVSLVPTGPELGNVESSSAATSRFSSFSCFVRGDRRVTTAVRNHYHGIRRTQDVSVNNNV